MRPKILITIEGGIIQHISTNIDNAQIVIVDYDGDAEETVSIQEYQPDTTFSESSCEFYLNMDLSGEEERIVQDYLKSIDF